MIKAIGISLILLTFCTTSLLGQEETLVHDDIERSYLVHLPKNYNAEENYPLVIALHGGTGSASNLQNQSRLSEKADEEGFIVVYPEGVKGGLNDIRTWNAGWCCGHASVTEIDDVGYINALLNKITADYTIDENRVYATGMSNGGYLSYRLACEIGHRFAAIAPVACSMTLIDCPSKGAVPIIHFHSFLDVNVRIEGGYGEGLSNHYSPPVDSVLNAWAGYNQCSNLEQQISSTDEFTHYQWSECSCDSNIDLYISTDGGHSWPGGRKTLLGDRTSNFIDATDLMWDFFEQHNLDCRTSPTKDISSSEELSVFPNPTSSFLRFEEDIHTSTIIIKDIHGNTQVETNYSRQSIDVQSLPSGIYFLLLQDEATKFNSLSRFIKI